MKKLAWVLALWMTCATSLASAELSSHSCLNFQSNQTFNGLLSPKTSEPTERVHLSTDKVSERRELVSRFYAPLFRDHGLELEILNFFDHPLPLALTGRKNSQAVIEIYGGIIFHPLMTLDAYTLVACHEIGHHLGGRPRSHRFQWASLEGQADLFATYQCTKNIFAELLSAAPTEELEFWFNTNVGLCSFHFDSELEVAVCNRSIQAALDLTAFLAQLERTRPPRVYSKDKSIAETTVSGNPSVQCRLDTLVKGALCAPIRSEAVETWEEQTFLCSGLKGFTLHQRPSCWFANFTTN